MRMDFKMQTQAPSFSRKSHLQVFLTMAAAEIALLAVLILSFIRYRSQFDLVQLSGALILALVVGSWMVRRSLMLSQIVFFFSLLTVELYMMAEPPFQSFLIYSNISFTPDYLPLLFLALDVVVLGFFLLREAGLEEEVEGEDEIENAQKEEEPRAKKSSSFNLSGRR